MIGSVLVSNISCVQETISGPLEPTILCPPNAHWEAVGPILLLHWTSESFGGKGRIQIFSFYARQAHAYPF